MFNVFSLDITINAMRNDHALLEVVNYFHLYMHAFEGLLEFYMVNNL